MARKVLRKPPKPQSPPLEFAATQVTQGQAAYYQFKCDASKLWSIVDINRRQDDKDEGYQRVLSQSRVRQVSRYIASGGLIPGSIIVSFDKADYDAETGILAVPNKPNAGWVIDGQHRLSGAHDAASNGVDIELSVSAYIGLSVDKQIELFITINREARGVSASLYIDLLKHLPRQKTEKEIVEERIADIAKGLNSDDSSQFYQAIVATRKPAAAEVSLVNFARIMRPLMIRPTGPLSFYAPLEQQKIIDNYYSALETVFPRPYQRNIFFRTLGFGAIWRAFPLIFNRSVATYKGFTIKNVADTLRNISDFDFLKWEKAGTGSAAEIQAGEDVIAALDEAFESKGDSEPGLKL